VPGDDHEGHVEAHVRRLEALRRAGIAERVDADRWRIPGVATQRRTVTLAAALAVLAVAVVCGGLAGWDIWRTRPVSSRGISLAVLSPKSGERVPAGRPFEVKVTVTGITLTPVGTVTNKAGEGHLHTYVDDKLLAMWSQSGNDDMLADVVIAVTGEEEDNLFICQRAKRRCKTPRSISRINNPKNEAIFIRLGIDTTISPTQLVLAAITTDIPDQGVVHLATLRQYGLELVELTLRPASPAVGKQRADLPLPTGTRLPYGDPHYHPIWEAAAELELPIAIHPGGDGIGICGPSAAGGHPTFYIEWMALGCQLPQSHLVSMICQGVFERFPELQMCWIETGVGWIPHLIEAIDDRYWRNRVWGDLPIKEPPSSYWYRNNAATFITDRSGIALRHAAGVDNIMWSSDYPHHGNDWPYSRKVIEDTMGHIPNDEKAKIIGENATRIWRLDD